MASASLIFCTVNCGTTNFTTITIKSILKFHPTAKVFVVDVVPSKKFIVQDKSLAGNIELVSGISQKDTTLPLIDISRIENLSDEDKQIAIARLGNPYKVLFRGSFNHSENIQLAIDTIDENFILLDSDAPLIRPVDFIDNSSITIAERFELDASGSGIKLLSNVFVKFYPFIQYLNVDMMRKFDVWYYHADRLKDFLKTAIVSGQGDKTSLWFDTGCLLASQIDTKRLRWGSIKYMDYVDHFGQASGTRGIKYSKNWIDSWKAKLNVKW